MPVVPEVKRIHSVCRPPGCVAASGTIAGVEVTCSGTSGRRSRVSSSETIASTPAFAITTGRCSRAKSVGQRIIRRATPSSLMSVSAMVSWSRASTSTQAPSSAARSPPRLEPCTRSPSATLAPRAWRKRSSPFAAPLSQSRNGCGIFVDPHEVAQRQRERRVVGAGERIEAELIFEPRDQHREAERIETGLEQHQIVGERGKLLVLLLRDLLHLRHYR